MVLKELSRSADEQELSAEHLNRQEAFLSNSRIKED